MKNYTHATYSFPQQHTGNNLVEKLKEVVSEYDIDDNSIFTVVHDQESNFQQAGHLLEDDKYKLCSSLLTIVKDLLLHKL